MLEPLARADREPRPIVPAILGVFEIAAWVRPPVDGSRARIIARHPFGTLFRTMNVESRQAIFGSSRI